MEKLVKLCDEQEIFVVGGLCSGTGFLIFEEESGHIWGNWAISFHETKNYIAVWEVASSLMTRPCMIDRR